MLLQSQDTLVLAATVVVLFMLVARKRSSTSFPLPPGPKGRYLIGSLLEWSNLKPAQKLWLLLDEVHHKHDSSIIHLKFGFKSIISISDRTLPDELWVNRAARYSDRPHVPYLTRYVSRGAFVIVGSADQAWKMARRAMGEVKSSLRAGSSEEVLELEAAISAKGLLLDAGDWKAELRRFVYSTLISLGYGKSSRDRYDPTILNLDKVLHDVLDSAKPAASIIDLAPALDVLPNSLAPWRARGQRLHDLMTKTLGGLAHEAQERQSKSPEDAAPIWLDAFIARSSYTDSSVRRSLLGIGLPDLMLGGIDTTNIALQELILLSLTQPHWIGPVRQQIDEVVGPDRMPSFADRPALPQVDAVVRELSRWKPQVPVIAHECKEDDVVHHDGKTYRIPKGAVVCSNIWSMLHDPSKFPDPDTFDPSRHLDPDGQLSSSRTHEWAFGTGWRVCPGSEHATRSLFIFVCTLLWGFDVKPPLDPRTGQEVVPDEEAFDTSITPAPLPFEAMITVRDEQRAELILRHHAELDKDVGRLLREAKGRVRS